MSSTSPSSAQPLLSTAVRAPPPGAFAVALAAPTADCLLIGYPCTAATAPTPDPPPALSPTLGSKFFLGLNAVAMALSMRLSNSPFPPIPLFTDAILGPSGGGRAVRCSGGRGASICSPPRCRLWASWVFRVSRASRVSRNSSGTFSALRTSTALYDAATRSPSSVPSSRCVRMAPRSCSDLLAKTSRFSSTLACASPSIILA
mmetsp:Transcript_13086/g.21276  ORF Transcript_13086/g.21276 Transcript_13086/m.21276 type:complete len:203 (+) Transcript_13086:555-1163(+)